MGFFSTTQGRCQTSCPGGSTWLYSFRHPHYSWEDSRCHLLGSVGARTRCLLDHGPRIYRFRSSPSPSATRCVLCDPSQKQSRLHPKLLSRGRSWGRITKRSNNFTQRSQNLSILSRFTSADQFLRYRKTSPPHFFNNQLCLASIDDCSALQTSLKDRAVLQMDQTISSYQSVLWHFRKRCENPNPDCRLSICVGSDYQKEAPNRTNTQRNSPSSKHHSF
jgi:hypothetical protein